MPDPSTPTLPPEWVEAIDGALERHPGDAGRVYALAVRAVVGQIADTLAPLLAERDAKWLRVINGERAEARRLRDALRWYADEENYDEFGVPYVGTATDPETGTSEGEWEPDRGEVARAAIFAASAVERKELSWTTDGVREWRISNVASFGGHVQGPETSPPKDCGLTGTDWLDAACVDVVAKTDVLRWVRERLTSNEAVEAWRRACAVLPRSVGEDPREVLRSRIGRFVDFLLNDTKETDGA